MKPRKMIVLFLAAFGCAFILAWWLFSSPVTVPVSPEVEAAPPPRSLKEDDIAEFFGAVVEEDYAAMARIGKELFEPGALIPDHKQLFIEYETASFPPYQVYAFYTKNKDNVVYRVLLTVDEEVNKVESFLAEDMPIVQ